MIFCSGCQSVEQRKVLKFSSWGSKSELEILKPIISDFESKNPDVKIEFIHIPQNYFQKIHLLFASNMAADVIFLNNLYLPIYANAGLLRELEVDDGFYEKALEALTYNGKLYAIPRDISNLVIYYNKDIFDKKNIDYPKSDWTFEEFLDKAIALTDDEVFGISFDESAMFYLPYLMSMGGGILSDDLSSLIIDDVESRMGLEFYSNLRKKYHVAPEKNESASLTMAQMFLQERLAMDLSGRWIVPKYREEAEFDWDIVNFPHGFIGSVVPMDASGWAISKSSKNPELAQKFIEHLSSRESIEKFSQGGLIVPARVDVATSQYFLNDLKPKNAKVFLDVIDTSKPTPVSVDYNEIVDELSQKLEYLFN